MKPLIKLLIISFLIVFASEAYAQYVPKDKRKKKETPVDTTSKPSVTEPQPNSTDERENTKRLTFGGNLSLRFGTPTMINIQPLVGYHITDKFTAGLGIGYQYYSYQSPNLKINQSYYGGRGFLQYKIVPEIFLWGEMDGTNGNYYNQETKLYEQRILWSPLIGGGYSQNLGNVGGLNFMILYNLNWNNTQNVSLYSSPWVFRVGYMF